MRRFGGWVVMLSLVVPALAEAQVRQTRDLSVYTQPSKARNEKLDFENADGWPVPQSVVLADQAIAFMSALAKQAGEVSGFVQGATGSGGSSYATSVPVGTRPAPDSFAAKTLEVVSQAAGDSGQVFSAARADLISGSNSALATNKYFPYRASGKLFFKAGGSTWTCSGALVKPGLVVTAAHCVVPFGTQQFYSGWQFIPGYRNGSAPYGTWTAYQVLVKTSWLDGTDACAVAGIVCENDVAIILLNPRSGNYPGKQTGWYGYYYGGAGFESSPSGSQTHVTQLAYPTCLDNGVYMERNDSQAFIHPPNANNTIIGSLMCGGSSGGPLLVNFGVRPSYTGAFDSGWADSNAIVGVTSWGYVDPGIRQQGASPFTAGNIQSLVTAACAAKSAAC